MDRQIKFDIVPCRSGGAAEVWADVWQVKLKLGFEARLGDPLKRRDTGLRLISNRNGNLVASKSVR